MKQTKVKHSIVSSEASLIEPPNKTQQAAELRERLKLILPLGPRLTDAQLMYRPGSYLEVPSKPAGDPANWNYLTRVGAGEREVVSVFLNSTLGDVKSIRARTETTRIKYFAEDEYWDEMGLGTLEDDDLEDDDLEDEPEETRSGFEIEESEEPVVFGRMILMIATCYWPSIGKMSYHQTDNILAEGSIYAPHFRERFEPGAIRITSDYYPGLTKYFEVEADRWYRNYRQEQDRARALEATKRATLWNQFLESTGASPTLDKTKATGCYSSSKWSPGFLCQQKLNRDFENWVEQRTEKSKGGIG